MSKKRTKKNKIKQSDRRQQTVVHEAAPHQLNVAKVSQIIVEKSQGQSQGSTALQMLFRYDPIWIARDLRKTIVVSSLILLVLLSIALLYT